MIHLLLQIECLGEGTNDYIPILLNEYTLHLVQNGIMSNTLFSIQPQTSVIEDFLITILVPSLSALNSLTDSSEFCTLNTTLNEHGWKLTMKHLCHDDFSEIFNYYRDSIASNTAGFYAVYLKADYDEGKINLLKDLEDHVSISRREGGMATFAQIEPSEHGECMLLYRSSVQSQPVTSEWFHRYEYKTYSPYREEKQYSVRNGWMKVKLFATVLQCLSNEDESSNDPDALEMIDSIGFSGVITALPSDNTTYFFSRGDEVFGVVRGYQRIEYASYGIDGWENFAVPISVVNHKPPGLSFDEAAAILIAGCCAYQFIYDCVNISADHRLLVFGGDTAVGSLSIGLAKKAGAWVSTIGVDGYYSDLVLSENVYSWSKELSQRTYDAVFDAFGLSRRSEASDKHSVIIRRKLLKATGNFYSMSSELWRKTEKQRSLLRSSRLLDMPKEREKFVRMVLEGIIPYHVEPPLSRDVNMIAQYLTELRCPVSNRGQVMRLASSPVYHFINVQILVEHFKLVTDIFTALGTGPKNNPSCLHSFSIRKSPNSYEMENWLLGEIWANIEELNAYRTTTQFRNLIKALSDFGGIAFIKIAEDCCDSQYKMKKDLLSKTGVGMEYGTYFVQIKSGCNARFFNQVRSTVPAASNDSSCALFSMARVLSDSPDTKEYVFVHIRQSDENSKMFSSVNIMDPFNDYCQCLMQFSFADCFTYHAIQFDRLKRNIDFGFQMREVSPPASIKNCAMVKVISSALNSFDSLIIRKDNDFGWLNPFVPGFEFSGIIYSLPEGGKSLGFHLGDEVFGMNWDTGNLLDTDINVAGGFAEYCMVPLERLTLKPPDVSFDLAASIPMAGSTAYQCLVDCTHLLKNERIFILGGDSPVGTIAIGLAKLVEARIFTTCSPQNLLFMNLLKPDYIYDHESFCSGNICENLMDIDVIVDTIGGKRSFERSMRVIRVGGRFVSTANEPVVHKANHPNLSYMENHIARHDIGNQRYLMEKKDSLIFPPVETFDFSVAGVLRMVDKIRDRTNSCKLVLRVSKYAMFMNINLKIPAEHVKKVSHFVDQYISFMKLDEACVHCYSMRSDMSTELLEDRMIVAMWRNEASLDLHKESEYHKIFIGRMTSLGCYNYTFLQKDLSDVLVSCPQLPSQQAIDSDGSMFHVYVEFDIAPGCRDEFFAEYMRYNSLVRNRDVFLMSALTDAVSGAPEGKKFFGLFHICRSAQAWTEFSNTAILQGWLRGVYRLCNVYARRGYSSISKDIRAINPLMNSVKEILHPLVKSRYNRISYAYHFNDSTCLRMEELDVPTIAVSGCAIIRVIAVTAHDYDVQIMKGNLSRIWNVSLPITPGYDFSGIITQLPEGEDSLGFNIGDEVFGANWGNGRHNDPSREDWPVAGTFSEFCSVPLRRLSRKPSDLSFDEAAAISTAGCTAFQCLFNCAKLASGQRVLILGGDTVTGTIAINLAKSTGAWVAATFVKSPNELSVDQVIILDQEIRIDERIDLILDTLGVNYSSIQSIGDAVAISNSLYISTAAIDIGRDLVGIVPCDRVMQYCFQSDSTHQDTLAGLVMEKKVAFKIAEVFYFNIDQVRLLMERVATEKSTGIKLLRVAPKAFFVLTTVEFPIASRNDALNIIRRYIAELKSINECLFCCYSKTEESDDELEVWMAVEVWNDERSMNLFRDNSSYLTILREKESNSKRWTITVRVSRDLDDCLIYCLKSTSVQPEDMHYIVATVELTDSSEANEARFIELIKNYGPNNRLAKGCHLYTNSKVIADDKIEYVIYYFHESEETFETSNDQLIGEMQSSIEFYRVCNVKSIIKSSKRPTYRKVVIGTLNDQEPSHIPFEITDVTFSDDIPPKHARIKVISASLNYWDEKLIAGTINGAWRIPSPLTPGYDFAGVIAALPDGDTLGFSLGDAVFGVNWGDGRHDDPTAPNGPIAGTLAEYCLVPLNRLSRKQTELSFDEAAAISMAGCTVYQCLYECAQLLDYLGVEQRVLILGGDTAVGIFSIQMAKNVGAWVGTVCSAANRDAVLRTGADFVHISDTLPWHEVGEFRLLDVLFDPVGDKDTIEKGRALLNSPTGIIVNAGQSVKSVQSRQRLSIVLSNLLVNNPKHQDLMAQYIVDGTLHCPITACYDFNSDGVKSLFQSLGTFGKQILRIAPRAYYSFTNLSAAGRLITDKVRNALMDYAISTQRDANNIFCDVQRYKGVGSDQEDWLIAQLWSGLTPLKTHLNSRQHRDLISLWERFGQVKVEKIFRDELDDQLAPTKLKVIYQKQSTQPKLFRLYILMEYSRESNGKHLKIALRKSAKRLKSMPSCIHYGAGNQHDDDEDESMTAFLFHNMVFANEMSFFQYRNQNATKSALAEYSQFTNKVIYFLPYTSAT